MGLRDITTTSSICASPLPRNRWQKCPSKLSLNSELIAELLDMKGDDPVAGDLGECLRRCEEARERERIWREERKVVGDTNTYYRCRKLACFVCRAGIVTKATSKAQSRFRGMDNRDGSFMTILLSPTAELTALPDLVKQARRKIRDRRNAAARKWPRWCSVELTGFVEVDARFVSDIPSLRPKLKEALQALPVYGCCAGADRIWLPHLHVLVRHEGVGRSELRELFSRSFPGPHRVDVRPFHVSKAVFDNVGQLISYGTKHSHTSTRDGELKERWPIRWLAEYYTFLHLKKRGLQPLSVSLGPKRIEKDDVFA